MKVFLLTALVALLLASPTYAETRLGVVSYWGGEVIDYDRIPDGSLAILNPSNGIFVSDGQGMNVVPFADNYKAVARRATKHDVAMLGYVPTGYFHHDCNVVGKCQTWTRIEGQVKAYFAEIPGLAGIFFDEAAPADWSCEAYVAEYQKLRDIVQTYRPGAVIAFNPGMADLCAVTAAAAGEFVVLFESDGDTFRLQDAKIRAATEAARARGVRSWLVINTVAKKAEMRTVVEAAKIYDPDFLYVVDVSGDWQAGYNTYGALPLYWRDEILAVTGKK